MRLPEGLTFTPLKLVKDFFGKRYLIGQLDASPEYVERVLCKFKEESMSTKEQSGWVCLRCSFRKPFYLHRWKWSAWLCCRSQKWEVATIVYCVVVLVIAILVAFVKWLVRL